MVDVNRLSEAFLHFTEASRSLESSYEKLKERVRYLTQEVEEKNRQLAEALGDVEEAKDYLQAVLQSMEEAVIVLDTGGRITMINRSASEMLCLEGTEVVGLRLGELDLSIEGEDTGTVLRAGGRRRDVIVSSSDVRDSQGAVRGRVVVMRDVTRIRDLELQHERNNRLIAMGEMAAKIVHEIRSPLCSIELYAGMLARELEGSSHVNLAKGISTGISSLNAILTNMLYFAKPQKPLFRQADIGKALGETVFMLLPMIESRGIGLRNSVPSGVLVPGDPELAKQLFLNILMNAIQVTPSGRAIETRLLRENGHVVIEVADEGEGIRDEDRERIFDPFFTTREKGTGLGLTIASRIVEAHGGKITVKSEGGKGSTFGLHFPVKRDQAPTMIHAGRGIFS